MSITFLQGWPVLKKVAAMFGAMWLLCAAGGAPAQGDAPEDPHLVPPIGLNERVLNIPGDPDRPVTLQVTVYTPSGSGPFPLAVVNHSATNISASNRGERFRYTYAAYYFLSRGYAVAIPMMRGFAGSGGTLVRNGCNLAKTGLANAKDIRAVIGYFHTRPDIDATRIIVAGQSFGGWNTLAFGTLDVPGVRGLVNFAGGIRESDCAATDTALAGAAASFGAHSHLPGLWFYGENDSLFPTRTWRAMYERYTGVGGQATLVDVGRFMDDSHQMLSYPESMPLWVPRLDQFLTNLGLPGRVIEPRYMPTPIPAATQFANVDDVARVPYLNDRGRALYRAFLAQPHMPRVFVVAPNGNAASTFGGFDPIAAALATCNSGGANCQVYAVDRSVVWSSPAAAVPASVAGPEPVRRTVPANMTTLLASATRLNPDCSNRGLPEIRIILPPSEGTVVVGQGMTPASYQPGSRFAICNGRLVPATEVSYTPKRGFAGADSLIFEETRADKSHATFNVELTVR